jgi:predicted CXXCH cytochrome family protein
MGRMKRRTSVMITVVLMTAIFKSFVFASDQCVKCHENLGDKPSSIFKHDVHFKKGISCAGCHGGNPNAQEMEQSMSEDEGFIGVPKGDEISLVCAKCHSSPEKMRGFGSSIPANQWENLQTSVHAKPALASKDHIVQCITCHSVHNIVNVQNPTSPVYPLNVVKTCSKCHADIAYMKTYNPSLPVDQLGKYRTSPHGMLNQRGDSKAAECASCHGSHDIRNTKDAKSKIYPVNLPSTCSNCHSNTEYMKDYNIPTNQYEKFSKSVHGLALLQKHDVAAPACNNCHGNHGATPPGIESISKVCGTCHVLNAELFSLSPHKKVFDERKLPECETCHGNHYIIAATDKLLGVSPDAVCSKCHGENDNAKGYTVARTMRNLLDSLDMLEQNAISLVNEAEQKGMEISESKFKLKDIRQARLQSRTMVHSFSEGKFREIIEKGFKISSIVAYEGQQSIDEYYFRRWGLAVVTLIMTVVVVSLYFVIRRLELKHKKKGY